MSLPKAENSLLLSPAGTVTALALMPALSNEAASRAP